jgi:DNA-binding NtrC family response regulator
MKMTTKGEEEMETVIVLPEWEPGKLQPMDLASLLRAIETRYIDSALKQTSGNRQAAATLLGLQRTTLVEKLRRRKKKNAATDAADAAAAAAEDQHHVADDGDNNAADAAAE